MNLIGRLLGRDHVSLQSDSLTVSKNGSSVASESIRECKEFATIQHGIFGAALALNVGNKSINYRFLKKDGAEKFLRVLNQSIAEHINDYLSRVFNEFNTHVISEYPRDSRLAQISELCQTLSEHFRSQAELWDVYLKPECIEKIKEIVAFHPLQAEALREHHEQIQLKNRMAFFNGVESNPLTHEQRLGVLRSNDKNMVLAAAGTGKTSVMVAKALDLIDRNLATSSEILVLAYNRAAAEELNKRVAEKAKGCNIKLESFPQISTFHALGRKLLRDSGVSSHMSVFTEDEIKLKQWVTSWLETLLKSGDTILFDFIRLFPEPVNPFSFKTQAEYETYVRDNEFRTLNGEKVKGYQELLIANSMYLNGIPYAYEDPYVTKRRIEIGFDYRPDFHIKDSEIYIEHFGVDRNGHTRSDIDPNDHCGGRHP